MNETTPTEGGERAVDPRWLNLATNNTAQKISEIKRIDNEEEIIVERAQMGEIVEKPCLAACLILYDKNIQTLASTANGDNTGQVASITVNYSLLSDENKAIAQSLLEQGKIGDIVTSNGRGRDGTQEFSIDTPVHENSTVQEVSDSLAAIASQFQMQDVLFGRKSPEYVNEHIGDVAKSIYGAGAEISQDELSDLAVMVYGEYDAETNCFWQNRELLEKHRQFVSGVSETGN